MERYLQDKHPYGIRPALIRILFLQLAEQLLTWSRGSRSSLITLFFSGQNSWSQWSGAG